MIRLTVLWRGRLETLQWQPDTCCWALHTGEMTIRRWRGELDEHPNRYCAELHAHDRVLVSAVGVGMQPTLDALAYKIAEIRRLTEPEPELELESAAREPEPEPELERAASDPAPDRYVDGQIEIQISGSARVTVEVYDTDTDETLDARVALAVGAAGRADAPAAAEGLRLIERACKEHAESARARVRDDGAQHALGAARAYEHMAKLARDLRGRRGDQR